MIRPIWCAMADRYPAITAWEAERRAGLPRVENDPLWRAAIYESNARDWDRMGCPSVAEEFLEKAAAELAAALEKGVKRAQ
jgi:hypothetical protein